MPHSAAAQLHDDVQIADGDFFESVAWAFRRDDPQLASKGLEADRVRCIQILYHAIARGAFEDVLTLTTDDFVLEIFGPANCPFSGRWEGPADVLAAMQRNFSQVAEQRPVIQSLVAQGDMVIIVASEEGVTRANGKPYRVQWIQEFKFRQGKICQVRQFIDGGGDMDFTPA